MRVIITDDDALVAVSLKTILESNEDIEVLAIGRSGEEAIELYERYHPDVVLMDISMEKMSGIEAGEQILNNDPEAKILYLTTFSDDEYIIKALKLGAKGYILKQDYEGIASAIKSVMDGQSVFGDSISGRLLKLTSEPHTFDYEAYDINEGQKNIIELVAKGLSNREISEKLYLSEGTVRNYISTLLDKLNLRDRTQLAIFYYTQIKTV